jgi:hypothetical protein
MLSTLVGLVMLLAMAGGIVALVGCLLAPRLRAHYARRHPQRAAVHQRERYERRIVAEWPLLAQAPWAGLSGPVDPPASFPGGRVCG